MHIPVTMCQDIRPPRNSKLRSLAATYVERCLALILLTVLASGCTALPRPDFSPNEPCFKIVTYNLNWGCPDPQAAIEYILKSDADVVCLQETRRQWEALLKASLSSQYPYSYFCDEPGAGGMGLMSKCELRGARRIEPNAGWFPALLAEVKTPVGFVQTINVHLRPSVSDQGSVTASALYYSPQVHREELDHFLAATDATRPLIIAGDFNESEKGIGVRSVMDKGFADALSLFDRRSWTWHWRVGVGITLKKRYDHILFSKELLCTGAKVSRVNASDHMPVFAVFVAAAR